MTGQKRFFRDLKEGGTRIHVELGDDARYQAQRVGTVCITTVRVVLWGRTSGSLSHGVSTSLRSP